MYVHILRILLVTSDICNPPVFVLFSQLLKYDKEVSAFYDVIREENIQFPPR